jgi:hypothetical protein
MSYAFSVGNSHAPAHVDATVMKLFELFPALIERTSQFSLNQWLLTFACITLACYALLISRRP